MHVNVERVVRNQSFGQMSDAHRLHRVHARAATRRQHGQNAGAAAEVEHHVAGSDQAANGALVGVHAMQIRQQSRVVAERHTVPVHAINLTREYQPRENVSMGMSMSNEKKKTPPVLDLRDLLREVLESAREESAQESGSQAQPDAHRQPNQP